MRLRAPDYVVLVVGDVDRAVAFYTGVLGLALGHRSGPYAQLDTGETRVALFARDAMAATLGVAHLAPPAADAPGFELGFKVDDVDAAYRRLAAAGAAPVTPPTDRPWGQRTAYVRDPDGHLLELASRGDEPSAWVRRFVSLIPGGGPVLDVAAGRGRHTRLLRRLGHPVVACDRDPDVLAADLRADPGVEVVAADLEVGGPPPFAGRRFAGVVVTNYLHRPLLGALVDAVADGGVLVYETFARGHERHGRPTNPAFLLEPAELLDAVAGRLRVVAYEDLAEHDRVIQRICAGRW